MPASVLRQYLCEAPHLKQLTIYEDLKTLDYMVAILDSGVVSQLSHLEIGATTEIAASIASVSGNLQYICLIMQEFGKYEVSWTEMVQIIAGIVKANPQLIEFKVDNPYYEHTRSWEHFYEELSALLIMFDQKLDDIHLRFEQIIGLPLHRFRLCNESVWSIMTLTNRIQSMDTHTCLFNQCYLPRSSHHRILALLTTAQSFRKYDIRPLQNTLDWFITQISNLGGLDMNEADSTSLAATFINLAELFAQGGSSDKAEELLQQAKSLAMCKNLHFDCIMSGDTGKRLRFIEYSNGSVNMKREV